MRILIWVLFNIFVLFLLALDLGVFHRKNRAISIKEALVWSGIWIIVAVIFNAGIFWLMGSAQGTEFFTCYLVERSLSVDNIFVFILIFSFFRVPHEYQYKILFWGILGALVLRAIFIIAGVALIDKFHWMIYIFGILLVYIGAKLSFEKEKEIRPGDNVVLKLFKKVFPVTESDNGGKFFVKNAGKYFATPLFLVLLVIETTDVIFAVDSIPAALAISRDSFIIYSANVFAILGLRALYFAVAGCMRVFRFLNFGLSFVLVFIGIKMLLTDIYPISINLSLAVIAIVLAIAIITSILNPLKDAKPIS